MELKLDPSIPYALALEGGGAKGAYQIGAWKALKEAGIRFSAVAGTSVGALNGSLIVMDDMEKAENVSLVPLDAGWSDVGSWDAVYALGASDREGNVTSGDVVAIDA